MNTIILTSDDKGDRSAGVWLRDLGFQLIEAGVEINLTRSEGDAAREVLAQRGLEVAQVVEAFGPSADTVRRAGATRAAGGGSFTTNPRGYPPHERYGGSGGKEAPASHMSS